MSILNVHLAEGNKILVAFICVVNVTNDIFVLIVLFVSLAPLAKWHILGHNFFFKGMWVQVGKPL